MPLVVDPSENGLLHWMVDTLTFDSVHQKMSDPTFRGNLSRLVQGLVFMIGNFLIFSMHFEQVCVTHRKEMS